MSRGSNLHPTPQYVAHQTAIENPPEQEKPGAVRFRRHTDTWACILWSTTSFLSGRYREMDSDQLKTHTWYWVRRDDGSLAPYQFHRVRSDTAGRSIGEFFVGSLLHGWPLSRVVAEARPPKGQ